MKKSILQTFEDFLHEPISILKNTIITITGIDTGDLSKRAISVENTKNGVQINVVNSPKAYKLLSTVMYKKQISELRHIIKNENQKSTIQQKFTKSKVGTGL